MEPRPDHPEGARLRTRTTGARGLRHAVSALLLVVVTCALVACGGTFAGQSVSGRVVTVGHTYGRTAIEGIPQRIVALGTQWLDAVEALGVLPVGYVDSVSLVTGGATAPWEPPTLKDSGAVAMDGRTDVVAQVENLKPDLILAPGLFADQQTYNKLSRIAPTIPNLRDIAVQSWSDQVNVLGKVLGREDNAKSAIANVNGRIDAVAAANTNLDGKSYLVVDLISPTVLIARIDTDDAASGLFRKLGMVVPQKLAAAAGSASRVTLGPDRVGDLDADLLIAIGSAELIDYLKALPPYATLPAVKKGSVVFFDPAGGSSLNLPSPLSLPYLIDRLEPALASAAR